MRRSEVRWKRNVYPFCGLHGDHMLPAFWTRRKCIDWLKRNYPDREVPRSACICCPYRTNEEWRRMRDEDPESFREAVEFDHAIRQADEDGQHASGMRVGLPFVHRQMVPLDQVDLRDDDERDGQPSLFGMLNECEGMCGV
jgi:hypothetical protein